LCIPPEAAVNAVIVALPFYSDASVM
jgi:hypothetical protein